jgi:MFS superfamily sulfate permease-like transporter
MTDGMCMGVVFGTTGIIDIATGISLGILLGLAVGMSIKKGA